MSPVFPCLARQRAARNRAYFPPWTYNGGMRADSETLNFYIFFFYYNNIVWWLWERCVFVTNDFGLNAVYQLFFLYYVVYLILSCVYLWKYIFYYSCFVYNGWLTRYFLLYFCIYIMLQTLIYNINLFQIRNFTIMHSIWFSFYNKTTLKRIVPL